MIDYFVIIIEIQQNRCIRKENIYICTKDKSYVFVFSIDNSLQK